MIQNSDSVSWLHVDRLPFKSSKVWNIGTLYQSIGALKTRGIAMQYSLEKECSWNGSELVKQFSCQSVESNMEKEGIQCKAFVSLLPVNGGVEETRTRAQNLNQISLNNEGYTGAHISGRQRKQNILAGLENRV